MEISNNLWKYRGKHRNVEILNIEYRCRTNKSKHRIQCRPVDQRTKVSKIVPKHPNTCRIGLMVKISTHYIKKKKNPTHTHTSSPPGIFDGNFDLVQELVDIIHGFDFFIARRRGRLVLILTDQKVHNKHTMSQSRGT